MKLLRIADFTRSPGGRYRRDGKFSGEWFRDDILVPALKESMVDSEQIGVELDGTSGYGSSFLEEAFGGIIRLGQFSRSDLRKHLVVIARSALFEPYRQLVERYLAEAKVTERTAA